MDGITTLQDLSRDEFFNHVGTVLVETGLYSASYFFELAGEARRRNLFIVEETVLIAAAKRSAALEDSL